MGTFFATIYGWFESLYGHSLSEYLWGLASPAATANQFASLGLLTLGISVFSVIAYYYLINHPRLSNIPGWLCFLVVNALICFFTGWQWVLTDYEGGLMYSVDIASGNHAALGVNRGDMVMFGVANAIISVIFYIILSLIFKWWSSNCRRSPF